MPKLSVDWPRIPLEDVLEERTEIPNPNDLELGLIPIINKIRFDTGKIELREVRKTKTKMILIRPGDLVLSGINAAKGAIAICEEKIPISATIHYSSYKANLKKIDILFLWYFLRSEVFQEILRDNVPGGIKTELKPKRFLPIKVPLPSLEEQHRIVARIEELTSRIEEAKALRRKAQEQAGAFLKGILSAIFPKLEPKMTLRACVDVNYGEGLKKCERDSTGNFDVFGSGGKIGRHNKCLLDKPFVVMGRKGSVGEITYASHGGWVIDTAYYITPKNEDSLLVSYLFYALKSVDFKESSITTAIPGINRETIYEKQIPVPSLSKQRRIVDYLDELQSQVDELRKYQAETQKEFDTLTQSILSKAFRGEL